MGVKTIIKHMNTNNHDKQIYTLSYIYSFIRGHGTSSLYFMLNCSIPQPSCSGDYKRLWVSKSLNVGAWVDYIQV